MLQTKFKVFLTAVLAVSILTISSCSKDFGNMNTNPTVALTPLTSALLTQVLSGVGSTYSWDQGGISTQGGLYCQYFSETQYTEASRYAKPTTNWDGYYAGNLKDLQTIIDYNTDPATAPIALAYGSNANQIAVARIMKAYIFWFLTDTWGDIPYNNIFQADNNGVVAYTSQQEIYNALFTELDEAVKQFDDGPAMSGDILFNKNITMWKKFANSTRAMMALRLSKVDATKGKSEFNAALSADGGVFETGEMAKIEYPGGNYNSPVYNYYNVTARKDYAVSDIVIDQLYNNFDDRYYVYGTAEGANNTAAGASIVGFPYGLTRDEAISFPKTTWARVVGTSKTIFSDGTDFNVATSTAFLLTSAEIYLARAEAAQLGWTEESIEDNYYEGISESYKQWKIYTGTLQPIFGGATMDGDDYFYYISQSQIALDGETDLEKIQYEQWVASFPVGWLGWANWRRTGVPELAPAPGLTDIPRRFPYGPNEYSLNTANANSAAGQYTGGGQSTDSQFGRVWWDVQ